MTKPMAIILLVCTMAVAACTEKPVSARLTNPAPGSNGAAAEAK
jgi:hypothetical protein